MEKENDIIHAVEGACNSPGNIYLFTFFFQETHYYLVSKESLCMIVRSLCAFDPVNQSNPAVDRLTQRGLMQ